MKEMGAVPIAEAKKPGFWVIGLRSAVSTAQEMARLVQATGASCPEHWAPTPGTTTLRMAILMGAQHRHGATVVDISAAFQYPSLPNGEKVADALPAGFSIKRHAAILRKSLYGISMTPCCGQGISARRSNSSGSCALSSTRRSMPRAPVRPF